MGCVPSFLFNPDEFKDIPFYNENYSKKNGRIITLHQNMKALSYMVISAKLASTFRNRRARMNKAFQEPLNELVIVFDSIETGIPRLKAKSDKHRIEVRGKAQLTYLKINAWEKTLIEEINARALKKTGFQELEVWNLVYFLVSVLTRLEQKRFAIDRVSFEDIVIQDKKFKYLYRPLYSQSQILLTTTEGRNHNKKHFQELFKQFKAMILFMCLIVIPLNKIMEIFDMPESKNIFTRLHEIVWVKFYPKDTKSRSRVDNQGRAGKPKNTCSSWKVQTCSKANASPGLATLSS